MMCLIYGGSGSGKSAFSEEYVMNKNTPEKIYLATMKVYDKEGEAKVERHRELRKDKGFITVEQPENIHEAASKVKGTTLLECMSNLVANEMFEEKSDNEYVVLDEEEVADKIFKGILKIYKNVDNLVVVSNNIFEDGIEYDESTRKYMRALAIVNNRIAKISDEIYEIVVGIPLRLK